MSDLFTRLAERAIREMQPRATDGFTVLEEPAEGPAPTLETANARRQPVVDRVAPPAEPDPEPTTATAPRPIGPTSAEPTVTAERPETAAQSTEPAAPSTEPAAAPLNATTASADAEAVTIRSVVQAKDHASPSEPASHFEPPSVAVSTPSLTTYVAVAQPTPAKPAWPADTIAPGPAGGDDEPAVEVHIGRLDVRANLEQPAMPTQPRPTSKSVSELTLSAYLRGERTGP